MFSIVFLKAFQLVSLTMLNVKLKYYSYSKDHCFNRLGKSSTEKDLSPPSVDSFNAGCQGDKAIRTSTEKGPSSLPEQTLLWSEKIYKGTFLLRVLGRMLKISLFSVN